ncbi:toxin-activating lysine-acyltransferase [Chitinimonas lacunae]|uniref:RTX toxin-activating lysine-acyltransferase n=1 Tax=Chitinimonas lacunae TaxID=1963018 RepID=A0ABV8MPC7_9NEIS
MSKRESLYRVFDGPGGLAEHFLKVGYVCHIMSGFESHQANTVNHVREMIRPAIRHDMMKLYFDIDGSPVGYVVWAFLADDVVARIRQEGRIQLHPSEFNEGRQLWIIDLLVAPGRLKYVMADLSSKVFAAENELRYLRLENGRPCVRHIRRGSDGRLKLGRSV